jgi:hypothetical protein
MIGKKAVNRLSPRKEVSALQTNTQIDQVIASAVTADWPRKIDWNVVRECQQRWDKSMPENAGMAIVKCLLAIAQLQTHDPIVLRRQTGYPLRFLGCLVWNLTRSESWLSEQGYLDLIHEVSLGRDKELDKLLFWLLEEIVMHSGQGTADLEIEWYQCTGVPIGS